MRQLKPLKIIRQSPFTGKLNEMVINLDIGDLYEYEGGRVLIQDAFPYLTADEREFIKTGLTSEDWATLGEEE